MTMSRWTGCSENDALSLEYELANRNPLRQANLSDFVGDSALVRFVRSEVSHSEEQRIDLIFAE